MQVRCIKCKSIFQIAFGTVRRGGSIVCTDCGARHAQRASPDAFSDPGKHDQAARAFAEVSGIDLPGANAVLLGIMSLRQAQELQDSWGVRATLLLRGRLR
jgi:predicted  nucleic acid-binding Zn-ribbon protein